MKNRMLPVLLWLIGSVSGVAADRFVSFTAGDVQLIGNGTTAIYVDEADCKGVRIAADNLAADIRRVGGGAAEVGQQQEARIVVGTLGHSALIDRLARQQSFDAALLKGKREQFVITTVGRQLVIAGSDRRGTIYGIYELSRQLGVSPWAWWADVPVARHEEAYALRGVYTDGEPAVRYRGLFLNDEAPCLTSWVKNTFGTNYGDHRFYARVFELILRLRGNFLWPAMWGWAFYADDPENSRTADEMGVIIGTSHHEPMARNHQEWARHRREYGAWNYQTNRTVIDRFFREGIERMRGTEDVVTIGMRGDGDEAMSEEADTRLLQEVVRNQRRIISQVTGRPARETPQVWALYKEVLDYYDKGMRVPDDVLMLLCDDNWGNLRRVPNARERRHPGGWGLYYHVDYVGAPRNSKWLNVTPTQNMWEQLQLAYESGIDRMWILNVGDLKPMEYPIQLFMDMAWDARRYTAATLTDHTRRFCAAQFGEAQAAEAARLLNLYGKLSGRSTAEMLDARTYNITTGEWRGVADEWMRLEAEALRQFSTLPTDSRDAYEQLVLFPIQALCNLHQLYFAQAMNLYCYEHRDPDANGWADRAEEAFRRDSLLMAHYNNDIAGGKWRGMMTQKHIGYTSWNDDFPADRMPEVRRIADTSAGGFLFAGSHGYVAMEAEHYHTAQSAAGTQWTVIPDMGRTRSGLALMPYTQPVGGSSLVYRFATDAAADSAALHVFVKSTLDYLNQGGLRYSVAVDGGAPVTVNFNANLNELPENIYTVYYPTVARRVVERTIPLGRLAAGSHTLTFSPLDPGIVVEKLVVDYGGYVPSLLGMPESAVRR